VSAERHSGDATSSYINIGRVMRQCRARQGLCGSLGCSAPPNHGGRDEASRIFRRQAPNSLILKLMIASTP
jgi:hypothetical protein